MTPKEKALKLIDKFTYEISGIDKYNYCLDSHIRFTSKNLSLMAINETISILENLYGTVKEVSYYKQVKYEIEKL